MEGFCQVSHFLGLQHEYADNAVFLFLGPSWPGWSGREGRQAGLEGEMIGTPFLLPPPRAKVNESPVKETKPPRPLPSFHLLLATPHFSDRTRAPWFLSSSGHLNQVA